MRAIVQRLRSHWYRVLGGVALAIIGALFMMAWALAAFGEYGLADAVLPWLGAPALATSLGMWRYRRTAA